MAARKTKATEKAADAKAPAAVSDANIGKVTLVIAAFPGTESRMTALWKRALGEDYIFKVITVQEEESLQNIAPLLLCDDEVADSFVFIPANTFPTAEIVPAMLRIPVVYISARNEKIFDNRLQKPLSKETLTELLLEDMTPEEFAKKAVLTGRTCKPMQVGHSFGNYVINVVRATPCEHTVIAGFIEKLFVSTNAVGWSAIEHLVDNLLS